MLNAIAKLVSQLADVLVKIPGMRRDWALHLLAGVPCAAYGAMLGWLAMRAEINMIAACAAVAGLTFAVTKELADHFANLDAAARGDTPLHGVELLDAAFGFAPSVLVAVAFQLGWI